MIPYCNTAFELATCKNHHLKTKKKAFITKISLPINGQFNVKQSILQHLLELN